MGFVENRMKQLGYGEKYEVRYRHFTLPSEIVYEFTIPADTMLVIIDPVPSSVKVESDGGSYYFDGRATVERQHVHWGRILITNFHLDEAANVCFIQVIPIQ